MKAWFGCTSKKLLEYIDSYKAIRDYLVESGVVVLFDWIEKAEYNLKYNSKGKRDIHRIYKEVVDAINKADFCVIENTVPNFSVAHQITYSLTRQKPTLVMWQKKDNTFSDSYLEALDSNLLTIKRYNKNNYKKIIDEFIGFAKIKFGSSRYNVVLDHKQRYYLDWAKEEYGKSRSAIIRESIDRTAKRDVGFKRYL